MPLPIPRTFQPSTLVPSESDAEADIDLANLVNVSFAGPIETVPAAAAVLLIGSLILPAAAEMLNDLTGTVANVVQIAHDVQEITLEQCFCDQLKRIADGVESLVKKKLKVEVLTFPTNTRITLGQNGGPDTLYPIGWAQFSEDNEFWYERHFINHPKEIIECDFPGNTVFVALWAYPGVTFTSILI